MERGQHHNSGRFDAGRFSGNANVEATVSFTTAISGLTVNPTYGNTAQIGVALTGAITGLVGGETVVHRWRTSAGIVAGATLATYTPAIGGSVIDLANLWYSPTVDGVEVNSSAYTVRYAAPSAADGLFPQSYATGSGDRTVNAAVDFTGSDIYYTVSTSLAGVTINSGTGVVTIPTGADATGTITVTGTNSGGADSSAFGVTIAAAVVGDVAFLSKTITGAGGVPTAEANGTYGQFTVAGGEIVGNTSPLTVGDTVIGSTTVSVVAGGYSTKATHAEIEAALAVCSAGDTIICRDGTATGARIAAASLDFSAGAAVTIKGENATQPTTINRYAVSKYTAHGTTLPGFDLTSAKNIKIADLVLTREKEAADGTGDAYIVEAGLSTDIEVTNCEMYSTLLSTMTPWLKDGVGAYGLLSGVGGGATTGLNAHDNYMHDLSRGYKAGTGSRKGWCQYNRIENCYGNFGEQIGLTGDKVTAVDFRWNYNRCQGIWSKGGQNIATLTGPNKPFAASAWKLPVADETLFTVGETVTGDTTAASATVVGLLAGEIHIDGPNWYSVKTGNGFNGTETLTGSLAGAAAATMTGEEVGTFPNDYGDPHQSLHGTGGAHNGFQMDGNIMLARGDIRRAAYAGTAGEYSGNPTGPKWNDPFNSSQAWFTNVSIKHNIFEATQNVGFQLGYMENTEFAFNTLYVNPDDIPLNGGLPSPNYSELGAGVSIHHNIAPGYSTASGLTGVLAVPDSTYEAGYENICAMPVGMHSTEAGWPMEYSAIFNGVSFNDLTIDNIAAALTVKTGGRADRAVDLGGTAYFDHSDNTLATVPAWTKPITTTATGVRNSAVAFGTGVYSQIPTLPSLTNADEFTIILGFRFDAASSDTVTATIMQSGTSSWHIRRVGNAYGHNYMELYLKSSGTFGYSLIAKSSLSMGSTDGFQVWTFTGKISTGEINIMKGSNIDPFVKITSLSGEPIASGGTTHTLGGASFDGGVEMLYVSDEFLDLTNQTVMDKVVSLDGLHPPYGADGSALTGTQPEIYLQGDQVAWNAGGGLNLGSDAGKYVVAGGSVTDITAATVPDAMVAGEWSATAGATAKSIAITLITAPADGGAGISDYEYTTDDGVTWTSLGTLTLGAIIVSKESDGTPFAANGLYGIRVAASNPIGRAPQSDSETVHAAWDVPAAMVDADWSVAEGVSDLSCNITIASAPGNGGSAITGYEYTTDAGATWVSLATATTGTVQVDVQSGGGAFVESIAYSFALRAVNVLGAAAVSNTEITLSKPVSASNLLPGFGTPADWYAGFAPAVQVTGGQLVFDNTPAFYSTFTLPAGRATPCSPNTTYNFSINVVSYTPGAKVRVTLKSYVGGTAQADSAYVIPNTAISATGALIGTFTSGANCETIYVVIEATANNCTMTFDQISLSAI